MNHGAGLRQHGTVKASDRTGMATRTIGLLSFGTRPNVRPGCNVYSPAWLLRGFEARAHTPGSCFRQHGTVKEVDRTNIVTSGSGVLSFRARRYLPSSGNNIPPRCGQRVTGQG
jgi:hypothetical protein